MNRCRMITSRAAEQPLYEHLQRSLHYTLDRLGPHGLPLIGRADWNDCLNLNCFSDTPGQSFQTTTNKDGKVAESVFIGGLVCAGCARNGRRLPAARGHGSDEAQTYHAASRRKWKQVVLQHGWDGDWFRRAYDDFGQPVGSHECEEGQIFIEPQGICVMAGLGLKMAKPQQALDFGARAAGYPARHCLAAAGLLPAIICTWAKFPPIRQVIKKTPAFSATPTPGL